MWIVFDLATQTNENTRFLLEFLNIFLSSFLGFGFALLLYYIKQVSDRNMAKKVSKSEYQNKVKYFYSFIESISESTQKQINSIEKYCDRQKRDLLIIDTPDIVPSNDFERLKYESQGYFDALNFLRHSQADYWVTDLRELNSRVDYIEALFKEILRRSDIHTKICQEKQNAFKSDVETIPDKLSSLAFYLQQELGGKRFENEEYRIVNRMIMKYSELISNSATFEQINIEFLDPLIKEILERYKNQPVLQEILFISKRARITLNDIKFESTQLIQEFEIIRKQLEKHNKRMEVLNVKINNVL